MRPSINPEAAPAISAVQEIVGNQKRHMADRRREANLFVSLSERQLVELDETIVQATEGLRDDPSLIKTPSLNDRVMPNGAPAWMSRLNAFGRELASKKNGPTIIDAISRLYPDAHDVLRYLGVPEEKLPKPQGK